MQTHASLKTVWLDLLGEPNDYNFTHQVKLHKCLEFEDFDAEIYEQTNGPGTTQSVLLLLPKRLTSDMPAVVVPFYYPSKAVGYDLDTSEPLSNQGAALALYLVRRGYIVITAESYHLTYINSDLGKDDFSRWKLAGETLLRDHPEWTGMGKLVADTKLLLDLLCSDARVDKSRIGIAGHSLGGKIAMYTACLDERIRVMLCSDFGLDWDASNWSDIWYWGKKLEEIRNEHIDHRSLLKAGGLKPMVVLAGLYDDARTLQLMREAGYHEEDKYLFINHASGHRPPVDVLEQGFDFLDRILKTDFI